MGDIMKKLALSAVSVTSLILAGCIESQSLKNAGQYQQSMRTAFIDQVNTQIAASIDDPYSVPMFANYGSGSVTTNGGFSLAPKWTSAPSGITREGDFTLGSFGTSSNLTITAINPPKGMMVARDLFAQATTGAELAPSEANLLLTRVPPFGWLHHAARGRRPPQCQAADACYSIGDYGKYSLFTSDRKSYSDFIILVYEAIGIQEQTETSTATKKVKPAAGHPGSTPPTHGQQQVVPFSIQPGKRIIIPGQLPQVQPSQSIRTHRPVDL
jgi:outer membrane murein-binding lipoprotein Lpp